MALFLVIQVPIMLALSLFFALALDSGLMRLAKFSRLAIFIPYAVPGVVATLMWGYLYGPDFGPFAQITNALGFGPPPFFTATGMLFSIMNIVNWAFIGYNMILIYAALRSIPGRAVRGGRGRRRRSQCGSPGAIKIPAIRPALLLTIIFSVIGTFQLFTEPSLMCNLAPNVIGTACTPNLYAYNLAFVNQDANYAAALAFLLGIVIMIVSYIVQLSAQRRSAAHDRPSTPTATRPSRCGDARTAAAGRQPRKPQRSWLLTVLCWSASATSCCRCSGWSWPRPSRTPTCSARSGCGSPTSTCSTNIDDRVHRPGRHLPALGANTVIYAVVSAVGAAFLATMAGYAFAKYQFPGSTALFAIILGAIMVPLDGAGRPDLPAVRPGAA